MTRLTAPLSRAFAAAALLVAQPAWADQIIVTPADNLQAAIIAANPGDQVLLTPGTHSGGVFASGVNGVTIKSQDPANPAIIQGGTNAIQLSDPVNVTIQDLIIQNTVINGLNIDDGGTFDTPAQNITLRNLVLRNIGSNGNHDGIKLSGVDNFLIDRVRVIDWGTGGSAVDMVGAHHGLIQNSLFQHTAPASTGVQAKGGTKDITVRANRFVMPQTTTGIGRAIQFGGSTDSQFFRFVPGDSGYEADDLTSEGNVVIGGSSAFTFVNIDGGIHRYNYVQTPGDWILRILNENQGLPIVDTQNGSLIGNKIVFDNQLRTAVNVGTETLEETLIFDKNLWYNQSNPNNSTPSLPTTETNGTYGVDPALDPDNVIAWDFTWGKWLVNANDQQNTFNPAPSLFVATPGPNAKFDPALANPLIGNWAFSPVTAQVQLDSFSQTILVNNTIIPAPSALPLLALPALAAGLIRRR